MDCGPTCLRMIARHYGKTFSVQQLREQSFIQRTGVNLLGISEAAASIGLRATGIRTTIEKLKLQSKLPCILHWNQEHFVVLYGIEKKKEKKIMHEIQKILSAENQRRKSNTQTSPDGEGEAGIFYIARSDLMQKNADYIHGNRIMFGSISVILLCVGLVNYFNIMFTGIVGRKKELEIMRKIGMTRRQERKLLLLEGSYYVLLVAGLVASVGSIILKGINVYMRKQLSYFTFHYPVGAIAGSIVIMEIMCVIICNLLILKKMKK